MSETSEKWSEYWQSEGSQGEVFVNARGEAHPALAAFWTDKFSKVSQQGSFLDLACGGGSVFAHLPAGSAATLTGADISDEAIKVLTSRFSHVTGVVTPAEKTPFDSASFDLIVSQFGVEYAGLDVFREVARLLKQDGQFIALAHYHEGLIDGRNARNLEDAQLVEESGFIDRAVGVTKAVFSGEAEAISEAQEKFAKPEQLISRAVEQNPQSVHMHLYQGFRQLYERRQAYDCADITGWLDGMKEEVRKTITRLAHMREAALSAEDISSVKKTFSEAGFHAIEVEPFVLPNEEKPLAWAMHVKA
jgi:SAM-dependent methyltransferase